MDRFRGWAHSLIGWLTGWLTGWLGRWPDHADSPSFEELCKEWVYKIGAVLIVVFVAFF